MKQKISLIFLSAVILFTALLSGFPAHCYAQEKSQTVEKFNAAVMDLDIAGGIPEIYQRTLSDRLRMELLNTGRFVVIERNAMEGILVEQGFQLTGCTSDECAIEMGRLLGVDRIIAGSVGRVGETHSVILRMIDVESGMILASNNVDCSCTIDEVMTSSLKAVAWQLAGLTPDEAMVASRVPVTGEGNLFVKSTPLGATVFIDDERQQGFTPLVVEKLEARQYAVRLVKENLVGFAIVDIKPAEVTQVDITLEKGGEISFKVNVDEGTLSINGKTQRATFPASVGSLPPGAHDVEVSSPGYETYKETVTVEADKKVKLDIRLKREQGVISFANIPKGVTVFLDEKKLGDIPVPNKTVDTGWYVIELKRKGYTGGGAKDIEIHSNETYEIVYDLEKKKKEAGSVSSALPRSFLWPGLGQLAVGRKTSGIVYASGEVLTFVYLFATIGIYNGKVQDYNEAEDHYQALTGPNNLEAIQIAYDAKIKAYDDAESARNQIPIASALAGGLYLWNVLDAILFSGGDNVAWLDDSVETRLSLANLKDAQGKPVAGVSLGITFGKTGRTGR